MKLSTIFNFLKDESLYNEIISEGGDEILEYSKRSKIKGASIPIILLEDINYVLIGVNELKVLCNAYLNGLINEFYVGYIVDALQLSEKVEFENEHVADAFSILTDPEVNGEINKNLALDILNGISIF